MIKWIIKKYIKEEIERLKNDLIDDQHRFMKDMLEITSRIKENDKAKFVWELRQEEVELMEDGKKLKKIIKMLS